MTTLEILDIIAFVFSCIGLIVSCIALVSVLYYRRKSKRENALAFRYSLMSIEDQKILDGFIRDYVNDKFYEKYDIDDSNW